MFTLIFCSLEFYKSKILKNKYKSFQHVYEVGSRRLKNVANTKNKIIQIIYKIFTTVCRQFDKMGEREKMSHTNFKQINF